MTPQPSSRPSPDPEWGTHPKTGISTWGDGVVNRGDGNSYRPYPLPTKEQRMTGTDLIAAERQRQIDAEGWTPDHDALHTGESLAWAAVAYAAPQTVYRKVELASGAQYLDPWPWQPDKRTTTGPNAERRRAGRPSKPATAERLRELIKAGALIAAEIDRIQRAQS